MKPSEVPLYLPDIIPLNDERAVRQVVEACVLGLWEVVNNLTRLRPVKRERYHVTIFGSARARPGTRSYEEVKRLASELAAMGCDIVTGGGPGLMQAANEGAVAAEAGDRDRSVGIRVELGFEQDANPFVGQMFAHRTFFSRLHHFVLVSDAFVVVSGGIGTTLETMMIWQLLQVRKLYGTPLIMIGEIWKDLVEWARAHMLGVDPPLADPADVTIPRCVEDVDQALAILRESQADWVRQQARE
jgi:uncharacterized protein (TIGR00730 family)